MRRTLPAGAACDWLTKSRHAVVTYSFRLYVAGQTERSQAAEANLRAVLKVIHVGLLPMAIAIAP